MFKINCKTKWNILDYIRRVYLNNTIPDLHIKYDIAKFF